jgi:hypothetical protein
MSDLIAEARRVRRTFVRLQARRAELLAEMYAAGMSLREVAAFWFVAPSTVHLAVLTHEKQTGESVMRPVGTH